MLTKEQVPKTKNIDDTLSLLKEGYLFINNRVDQYHSDIFETHLLGQKVICITGEEATKLFYDPELFQRNGAAPKRVQKTLFGESAIQTMDGEAHTHRKQLFISLMGPDSQKQLNELAMKNWEAYANKWERTERVVLFDEAKEVLCRTACEWAGVPLPESDVKDRTEDFSAMIYSFGSVGPKHWKGVMARNRSEAWIKSLIEDVRSGKLKVEENSSLYAIAFYKDLDGNQMDPQMAAVELINILRPIVAISTFIAFAVLAIYEHPECEDKLLTGDSKYLELFSQEVRRYYPFTPFVGARVRKDFTWKEYNFKEGTLVLLDIYKFNRDPRIWKNPDEFRPERFTDWNGSLFDFIPQGGGDPAMTHRCPGEGITVEIMKTSLNFLINKINFDVPEQDLSYSLAKIPTLPESGFIISNIRRKHQNS